MGQFNFSLTHREEDEFGDGTSVDFSLHIECINKVVGNYFINLHIARSKVILDLQSDWLHGNHIVAHRNLPSITRPFLPDTKVKSDPR